MNSERGEVWHGVAIITGASSGIGDAIARKLAPHAKGLVITARRTDRIESLAAELGDHVLPITCDVTDQQAMLGLREATMARFGQIDAIINNAGVLPMASMARCHVDDWVQAVDINVKGVLFGIAAALPQMLEQNTGHIINISSEAGRKVFAGAAVYCGTKHAVHAISEGLQLDLSERSVKDGNTIKVTTISPGMVFTDLPSSVPFEPARKQFREAMDTFDDPLQPEDIANSVLFALSTPDHVEIGEVAVRPTKQSF